MTQAKTDNEKLDDSSAELMMTCGGRIMLFIGESFIEVSEEFASECNNNFSLSFLDLNYEQLHACPDCTKKQEELTLKLESLKSEETGITTRQVLLKKELYGRFGDTINLEA